MVHVSILMGKRTPIQKAQLLVLLFMAVYVVIALRNLSGPFLSYHNERQNQTFDTANHIFKGGWHYVFSPQTSISLPGYEARPFTIARQEFPFHGVLAWPIVSLFKNPATAVCLVSVVFACLSIQLLFLILGFWLKPEYAVAGVLLWVFSPLFLHFGQVPMPDILCTTGMLAAFFYAMKDNLAASSGLFLFAILAKINVIFFGLPILAALLAARNCQTLAMLFRISVFWGIAPLVGIIAWLSLEIIDPDTPWTVANILSSRGGLSGWLSAKYYVAVFALLIPYGLGIMGLLGCVRSVLGANEIKIRPSIKWSIIVSNVLYLFFVLGKILEPQYVLPVLAWGVLSAACGFQGLESWIVSQKLRRAGIVGLVCLHCLIAVVFTFDLKSSRVPDFKLIEESAKLIPPHSRIIVSYPFYGASPAVWFDQNVLAVDKFDRFETSLPDWEKMGFQYVVLMDIKNRSHNSFKKSIVGFLKSPFQGFQQKSKQRDTNLSDFAVPSSRWFQYCDARFERVFMSKYVVVYKLPVTRNTF